MYMYSLLISFVCFMCYMIIRPLRTRRNIFINEQTQTSSIQCTKGNQTNIKTVSVETQTETINFSLPFKIHQTNPVVGNRRVSLARLVSNQNVNRHSPLPGGRGQVLNRLLAQGVGRGTTLGQGRGRNNTFGRGAIVWPLPPGARR